MSWRTAAAVLLLADAMPAMAQTAHVPPPPPTHDMPPMSAAEMIDVMGMDDRALFGTLIAEQLEWAGQSTVAWDVTGWYGGDFWKVVLDAEGEHSDGTTAQARTEVLVDRIVTPWWSTRAGLRHDGGPGPSRDWFALGVEGLAPYWFEIEATAYVGDAGRTAFRLDARYDLRITQRLLLQPQLEIEAFGKDDPERGTGSGFSSLEAGLRLRYEFRREFAPYVGVSWTRLLGDTADVARDNAQETDELDVVLGLRLVF